mmetsp:Transcript_31009/g.92957  ORF Transcript_31009/g.92957 Transcript_31009/m.92957 type:complete len:866 (-) Transcript_31009:1961-4558(-)
MSLAASAGGGGMGGGALSTAAMAHGGPSGMTMHRAAAQPPPGSHAHFAGAGVSAPGNLSALGADLVDKSQRGLGLRAVRNVSSLPLVAVDLYGEGGEVAYFPPVPRTGEDGEGGEEGNPAAGEGDGGPLEVHAMGGSSRTGTDLVLKRDDDAAHKAVRRMLTKGEGHYDRVFSDALIDDPKEAGKDGAARIVRPHLLLGARRTAEVRPSALEKYAVSADSDSAAIAPEDESARSVAVSIRNSTLDGSGPKGDDYDRVSFHLSVHKSKKSIAVLPEEATGVIIARSKKLVDRSWSAEARSSSDVGKDGEEAYHELPAAVAVPGWANLDSAAEALLDAAGPNAALYQRSVAACAGALLPNAGSGENHCLIQLLGKRMSEEGKARQKREQSGAEDGPTGEYLPTLVLAGMTSDGIELTTIQLGQMQDMDEVDGLAPFGDLTVHTTVCLQASDPLSSVKKAMKTLVEETDALLPELFDDDGGPAAIVTYGTVTHQLKLKDKLEGILKAYKTKGVAGWDDSIPFVSTREECVACGTALLAAVSHGRVYTVELGAGAGKTAKKHRARPGVSASNASCSAVGVRYNYFDGKDDKWEPVKTIFDFDRRVPAGPYQIDMSAAEAAVIREAGGAELDEEKLIEETKRLGGGKNIPKREAAALAMRVQVVQRTERGGEWLPVGDLMRPLTMMKGGDDDDDEDGESSKKKKEAVACESSQLDLSLGPVGLINCQLVSDGQTIVQATKSARNSALRYYLGIIGAILFFGGFLVKSYVEEKVFERDTRRVLAYYKRAATNSLHDGDLQGARYLVWKYKGKKAKLWRRLEAKYDMPVKHEWEWDDGLDDPKQDDEEEEEQNLDDEEEKKGEDATKEEQDL